MMVTSKTVRIIGLALLAIAAIPGYFFFSDMITFYALSGQLGSLSLAGKFANLYRAAQVLNDEFLMAFPFAIPLSIGVALIVACPVEDEENAEND